VILLALLWGLSSLSIAKDMDDSQIMHIGYPDWFIKSEFLDLTDDLSGTRERGKKGLMVLFTTEGCSYCNVFIYESLGNPDVASRVQKHFDSIGMEIFDDTLMVSPAGQEMPIKVFAKQEGVQYSPTLLFYASDGKKIFVKTGYLSTERFQHVLDYLIDDHYLAESWSSYARRITHASRSAEPTQFLMDNRHFDQPPYALDRSRIPASQPLLVLFESANCATCVDFHNKVLALEEIDQLLGQFQVVRLDINDDKTPVMLPSGMRETPAGWFAKTGYTRLPTLLLFDPNGNVAMQTDTLVLRQRMSNILNYMQAEAYKKGWTYQRFARNQSIKRNASRQPVAQQPAH